MKYLFVNIIFLLLLCDLNSQLTVNASDRNIDALFEQRGELYFVFAISDRDEIKTLTKIISIDNVKGNLVFAYANKRDFTQFCSLGYTFEILPSPGASHTPYMCENIDRKAVKAWNFYPAYDAYENFMYQFEADFPLICKTYNIGTLASGRKLLAVKISDNVNIRENEPQFLYTSTMHGDELVGYILMLRLIDYLLSNYGIDPRVTRMVDNMEIWINPNANPDGTYKSGNNTVMGATRGNANNIDLNRNYPDPQYGPHPDGNNWQQETIHFMNLADSLDFVMAANIHSGAEVVNYPWDTWPQLHADNNWWFAVSREYADTVHLNSPAGYLNDLNNGITNGYAWYTINGGRQDYMNYFQHCREVTLELSNVKILPETQLEDHWEYNYRSLLNYMEEAMYGLNGIIIDSCTQQPLKAKVFVNNHDFDESHVFSSLPLGNYHRPIYTGIYSVTYSSAGYNSKTYNNIFVAANDTTTINVTLSPAKPLTDFTVNTTHSCTGLIKFTDQSVVPAGTIYQWDFGDGNFSVLQNPTHTYSNNGTYTVKLKLISPCSGSDSLVKTNLVIINKPDAPLISDVYSCGPDSLLLYAPASGITEWYDYAAGGASLDTGSYFQTPFLVKSKTYYVQNVVNYPSEYTGKQDNSGGGGIFGSNVSHFLYFDAIEPFTLLSVKIYADGNDYRNIELRDNTGAVINSKNAYIPDGESRVFLDFEVPAGTDLQLAGPPSPGLYRNSGGLSYPYEIPGLISITRSSAGSNPTGFYYFFYDWEVRKPACVSNRVPLKVIINHGMPVADFSYTIIGNTIFFINNSLDANNYYWDFDDGDTSTLKEPEHEFLFNGLYNVKLLVSNSCGADSMITHILVTGIGEEILPDIIDIYPNPMTDGFNLGIFSTGDKEITLSMFDILGRTIIVQTFSLKSGENTIKIKLPDLIKGLYYVSIQSKDTNHRRRIVIQ